MRASVKACRKGCKSSTDVTQFKVNRIIEKLEKLEKWERYLKGAEKGTRLAIM